MRSKSPHAESLICWAASTKNRSYSGFYCTPDLEQNAELGILLRCSPTPASRKAISSSSRPKTSLPVMGNLATEIFSGPSLARRAPPATTGALGGSGHILEALLRDRTPRVDRACYHWHRLQKFGRVLKTPTGVFLEEDFNQNNDRLRDTFKSFER